MSLGNALHPLCAILQHLTNLWYPRYPSLCGVLSQNKWVVKNYWQVEGVAAHRSGRRGGPIAEIWAVSRKVTVGDTG